MTTSLIAQAVEPLRTEAMDRAEQHAKKLLMEVSEKLAEHGGDRNMFAPYPKGTDYGTYHAKKGYYDLVRSCTKSSQTSRSFKEPDLGHMDFDTTVRFIQIARENASSEYDAYIAKLEVKIGEVSEATLSGNHVWSHSILNVVKVDGTSERWKTQMIINVSKLGKLFNQFPTRKVK